MPSCFVARQNPVLGSKVRLQRKTNLDTQKHKHRGLIFSATAGANLFFVNIGTPIRRGMVIKGFFIFKYFWKK
jgi:hypothetical protein